MRAGALLALLAGNLVQPPPRRPPPPPCGLKPGVPPNYRPLCNAAPNRTICSVLNLTCAWSAGNATRTNYTCDGPACVPSPGGPHADANCSNACAAPPPAPPPAPSPCPPPLPHPGSFAACTAKGSRWQDCMCKQWFWE